MKDRLKEEQNAVPPFLGNELAERHYNGFSSTHSISKFELTALYAISDIYLVSSTRDGMNPSRMGSLPVKA